MFDLRLAHVLCKEEQRFTNIARVGLTTPGIDLSKTMISMQNPPDPGRSPGILGRPLPLLALSITFRSERR
jgi:hypothetical protein